MNIYRWLAKAILALTLIVPTLVVAVLGTETGSRWALSKALNYTPIDIQYEQFTGQLLNEFSFKHLEIKTSQFSYSPNELRIAWHPLAILSGKLDIQKIASYGGEVRLRTANTETDDTDSSLPVERIDIQPPLAISLANLTVSETLFFVFDTPPQKLTLHLSAELSNSGLLTLDDSELKHQYLTTSLSGEAKLSYPFKVQLKNGTQLHSPDYPALKVDSQLTGSIKAISLNSAFKEGLIGQLEGHIEDPTNKLSWGFESKWAENNITPWLESFNIKVSNATFSGSIKGSGDLKKVSVSPNLALSMEGQQADINGQLSYGDNQLFIEKLALHSDSEVQGIATVRGKISSLDDSPYLSLSTQWDSISYQEQSIASHNGVLTLAGQLNELAIDMQTEISGVQPESINIKSSALLTEDTLNISNLSASHKDSTVSGQANINWSDALTLQADISGSYLQRTVMAHVQLKHATPYLFVDEIKASWGGQSIEVTGALSPGKALNWEASSTDLSQTSALEGNMSLAGSIRGALNQEEFSIELEHFSFKHPDYKKLYLTNSVNASVGRNLAFKVTPVCLSYTGVAAPLCLYAEQTDNTLHLEAETKVIPLEVIQSITLPSSAYRLGGNLSLNIGADFNLDDKEIIKLDGFINADNTQIKAGQESVTLNQLSLKVKTDNNTPSAEVTAQSDQHAFSLTGAISTDNFSFNSNLDGKFELNSKNLELINLLLPQIDIGEGQAHAFINVSGSTKKPSASGTLRIDAERMVLLRTGTLAKNLNAKLKADANAGEFNVDVNAELGKGEISIAGQFHAFKQTGHLNIAGDNLLLVDTPDIYIQASPDITVKLEKRMIDVTGNVGLPKALISPVEFNQAATESADVRQKNEEKKASFFKTKTDITVSLGDDVRVEALGFAGQLRGGLQVTQQPNSPAKGNGTIGVQSGEYEIYGQKLTVERGDVLFNGGPLSSPSLNLKVTRNIASSSTSESPPKEIGARVTGNIEQPSLSLFSTPPMPDSMVLSYLLFGKPPGNQGDVNNLELQAALLIGGRGTKFLTEGLKETFNLDEVSLDSETSNVNDTSLYIGKHLSPDLYIKYGIGLIEPTSTFILRYSLSERLIFESTSTSEGQGGDLIYTIEN